MNEQEDLYAQYEDAFFALLMNEVAEAEGQELLKKNLTSREFVTLCYRTYLDRNPDQAGLDAWVKLMNEGSSMEEILDGFIGSQEFTNMCARYGIDR